MYAHDAEDIDESLDIFLMSLRGVILRMELGWRLISGTPKDSRWPPDGA